MLRQTRQAHGVLGQGVLKVSLIGLPEDVRYILDTLHRAGHEAYVVGGCVRDPLIGCPAGPGQEPFQAHHRYRHTARDGDGIDRQTGGEAQGV